MNYKNVIVAGILVNFMLSSVCAADNDPLQEISKENAANAESPLLEEAKKQSQKPNKKNIIYQWVDENGKTVISDIPHEGAIEIQLPEPQTYSAPKPKINPATQNNDTQKLAPKVYENFSNNTPTLKILSPVNDSWLDNNQGNLQVNIEVEPLLGAGQTLVIILDGKEISRGIMSQVNLQGLDRGSHTLLVEVQQTKTKKVMVSEQSSFNVRRPTVKR